MEKYKAFIFDCDGVILNSNSVKAYAFYKSALPYGEQVATAIKNYHMANGGISRFLKFRYVFEKLLGRTNYETEYQKMVEDFSFYAREGLMQCTPVTGIRDFLFRLSADSSCFCVSGAEEEELRWCLEYHGLSEFFCGIYGSPKAKPEILANLIHENRVCLPAIYFGDSKYDYLSSTRLGYDFIFVSEATDFGEWESFTGENKIKTIKNFVNIDL